MPKPRRPAPCCQKCNTVSELTSTQGGVRAYKCPKCQWRMRVDIDGQFIERKNSTQACPNCGKYGRETIYSHKYVKKFRCRQCEHVYMTDPQGQVENRPVCSTCNNMMQVGRRRGEAIVYICNTCPETVENEAYAELTKNSVVKQRLRAAKAEERYGVPRQPKKRGRPAGAVAKKAVNASTKSRAAGDYVAPVPKLIHPDVKYPDPFPSLFPRVEGTQKPGTSARSRLEAMRDSRQDYDPLFG